jgi:hypothetical protein
MGELDINSYDSHTLTFVAQPTRLRYSIHRESIEASTTRYCPVTSAKPSPKSPPTVRTKLSQVRSHARKVMFVIAMVLVAIAWPVTAFTVITVKQHFFEKGSSPSYQAGYDSGASGWAHQNANSGMGPAALGQNYELACAGAYAGTNFDEQDFKQGCLAGLRDNPPAKLNP